MTNNLTKKDKKPFYEILWKRGMTIEKLAEVATCGRSHLQQVIAGKRTVVNRHGKPTKTWHRLKLALTQEEIDYLVNECLTDKDKEYIKCST